MRLEKSKNTSRNIIWGVLQQLFSIGFPIIYRAVFIRVMAVEYLGLSSLFSAVFSILNIAELGFGGAMVACMYKPIAEDDTSTINAMYKLYRDIYRIIGTFILIAGVMLIPFLPQLIKGSYPQDVNIYIIYLMYLFNAVFGYWVNAYKNSLLMAHQRYDVGYKRGMIINVVTSVSNLLLLVLFRNIYLVTVTTPISVVVNNIWTGKLVDHLYPQYKCEGKLDQKTAALVKTKVFNVFCNKIGYQIQNSIDTMCITRFLGLAVVATYNNYYYIQNAVLGFVTVLFTSVRGGLGNMVYTDDVEANKAMLDRLQFNAAFVATWATICLTCLYQPFMEIWTGKEYLNPYSIVVCLVVLFYINVVKQPVATYKDALGLWDDERIKPLVAAGANLALSILALKYYESLEGVILATIVAVGFISMPWETKELFDKYFKQSSFPYFYKQIKYALVAVVLNVGFYKLIALIPDMGVVAFVAKAVIVACGALLVICLIYCRTKEFGEMLETLSKLIPKEVKNILRNKGRKL